MTTEKAGDSPVTSRDATPSDSLPNRDLQLLAIAEVTDDNATTGELMVRGREDGERPVDDLLFTREDLDVALSEWP